VDAAALTAVVAAASRVEAVVEAAAVVFREAAVVVAHEAAVADFNNGPQNAGVALQATPATRAFTYFLLTIPASASAPAWAIMPSC